MMKENELEEITCQFLLEVWLEDLLEPHSRNRLAFLPHSINDNWGQSLNALGPYGSYSFHIK